MGLFSDILEANRERSNGGYVDPCMIMSSLGSNCKCFDDYRAELNRYKETEDNSALKEKIRQEFIQKSSELEKLKAGYLVAEKAILEIINRRNIQSVYMQDMLDTLQFQLRNAYRAICQLRSEIDTKFGFHKAPAFQLEREDVIRIELLNKLINTTLHHMEDGLFVDTSTFRNVVSDCAEVIRCLKNENYRSSDKSVFSYYLMETVGLKITQHKCCNCGKPLLSNTVYCLNCYERNT
jgi:hypothetical protein